MTVFSEDHEEQSRECFLYFFRPLNYSGVWKVGITFTPKLRARDLAVKVDMSRSFLVAFPDRASARAAELEIHSAWADLRADNRLFRSYEYFHAPAQLIKATASGMTCLAMRLRKSR